MTIGQRRRHKSASVKKIITMADKQKAKMHEAAQLQLFLMSDVQGELHKKQPPSASRKRRAAERERHCIRARAHDHPQVKCEQNNIPLEEKAFVKRKENTDKELKEEGENASGGVDYLLILANSAELMESEGKCCMEKTPDITQDYSDLEAEKGALRVRGRIRLTQIRHRARLENSQQTHETNIGHIVEHANLKLCEDAKGCKSVETNQVRAMNYQNDQDQSVLAKSGNTGTANTSRQAFKLESMKVNNENFQESAERHVTILQPVSMTAEHGKFKEKQSDAHQLIQVGISKTNDPLKAHFLIEQQEHMHAPLKFHTEQSASLVEKSKMAKVRHSIARERQIMRISERQQEHRQAPLKLHTEQLASLVQKSETAKVRHSIARERRMMRISERRKQRHTRQFQWLYSIQMRQMFEAQQWWMWYFMNHTGELSDLAKQQKSLYMSYVEREQRRVSARQRRAQKIQEKRALKNMHLQSNSPCPVECHSPPNSNVVTGAVRNVIPVEDHPTIAIVCEDQCGKLQQQTTNVDNEEKASSVKQIRLTRLKREVRLKHSAVKMEKLTQQMDKGDESTSR